MWNERHLLFCLTILLLSTSSKLVQGQTSYNLPLTRQPDWGGIAVFLENQCATATTVDFGFAIVGADLVAYAPIYAYAEDENGYAESTLIGEAVTLTPTNESSFVPEMSTMLAVRNNALNSVGVTWNFGVIADGLFSVDENPNYTPPEENGATIDGWMYVAMLYFLDVNVGIWGGAEAENGDVFGAPVMRTQVANSSLRVHFLGNNNWVVRGTLQTSSSSNPNGQPTDYWNFCSSNSEVLAHISEVTSLNDTFRLLGSIVGGAITSCDEDATDYMDFVALSWCGVLVP